jgi:hypothetical protein
MTGDSNDEFPTNPRKLPISGVNRQNLKFTPFKTDQLVKTGMSEFKLNFLNRQSSSQNKCNVLLEIHRDRYTQYLPSNEAHNKI